MSNPIEAQLDAEMKAATPATPGIQLASASGPAPVSRAPVDPVGQAIDREILEKKFGTTGQQILTAAEGFSKGLAGPLATGAEAILHKAGVPGISPEEQAARAQVNPVTHGASEIIGFVAPAIATAGASAAARAGVAGAGALETGLKAASKFTQAGVIEKVGKAVEPVARVVGLGGPGAGVFAKIGSSAVRGAVENGLYQVGDETSRLINADPNQSVQTAIANVGLSSLVGGGLGGGAGTVSALWRATLGSRTGAILNSISNKVGGIEGVTPNPVDDIISKSGMELPPEIQAGLTKDPAVREMFHILNQSDTTTSGREFQQTMKDFHQKAGDTLAESLGRKADQIPDDFDKYSHGKTIGNTLADEVSDRVGPLKRAYEEYGDRFKGKALAPSTAEREAAERALVQTADDELTAATKVALDMQKSGRPEAAIEAAALVDDAQRAADSARAKATAPGTVDILQSKIAKLADDERWVLAPDDEIMKAVGSIQRELPRLKTLSDLTAYIKRVEEKLPFDPLKGPRNRAAGMIKGILRDTEGELIAAHIGEDFGAESLGAYRTTQKAYAAESKLKDELESRLGRLGSTSSYSKAIREMASSDAEGLFRKLSGKDDADALRLLSDNFPKTARALREAYVDQIFTKAKVDGQILPNRVMTQLSKLSPQLRSFVVPPQSMSRVEAIGHMVEQLKDTHFNYSGTGRAIDKLFQHVPGTAVGLVSMILGGNPALALALGALTKYVSKDAPDAVRLGLLKWMGSNKPIEAGAFKSMVDFIHQTIKGDDMISKSTRSLVSGASKVIPEHLIPDDRSLDELEKKLRKLEDNPDKFEGISANAGYYLPNHGIAMAGTAASAMGYLSSLRPASTKSSPLEPMREPTAADRAKFRRVLMLAQQPMMLAQLMKDGTLTTQDVQHVRTMYPHFYSRLTQKMTEAVISHISKDQPIPYKLRFGLSVLLGQPMDSSMSAQNIMSNQAVFDGAAATNPEIQAPGGVKPTSKSMREMKPANRLSLRRSDDSV